LERHGTAFEALLFVDNHRPDIVLMDISMPQMNGIEATITSHYPATIIIGLSANTGTVNEEAMTRAGADRLIRKEAAVDQLYDAIRDAVKKRERLGVPIEP
jgi:DNA-binding NarL/FixJ family response regulator